MENRLTRTMLTVVLVVSAAVLAIGVAIERHDERSAESPRASTLDGLLLADSDTATGVGETHSGEKRSGETRAKSGESSESPAKRRRETPAEHRAERARERVFGIDIESTPLVIAAVGVSLVWAVALWLTSNTLVPLAIAGFALVAAVFDVREVFHQIDESRTGLAVLAGSVAVLHAAAVALALSLIRAAGTLVRRPAT